MKTAFTLALIAVQGLIADCCQHQMIYTNEELTERVDAISDCTVFGDFQGRIAPATIDGGFIVGGSYIYWNARIDGLDFGQAVTGTGSDTNHISIESKTLDLNFKWKSGFKVNVGYIFSCWDQIDINFIWTSLHSKAKHSFALPEMISVSGGANQIKTGWFPLLLGPSAQSAAAQWRLKFDTIDGLIGKNFFLGRYFTLHPFAGLKGVWIRQNYNVQYLGAYGDIQGGNSVIVLNDNTLVTRNNFKGVGFNIGLDAEWFVTCRWSIFSHLATSLIYGKFLISQDASGLLIIPNVFEGTTIHILESVNMLDHPHKIRPNIDTQMGIRWQRRFCNDAYSLQIAASYIFSYWFRQNELMNQTGVVDAIFNSYLTTVSQSGDLQLQGLVVDARFDF